MNKKTILLFSTLLTSLIIKNSSCGLFDEMDKHFKQMEQKMFSMKEVFNELEEKFYKDDSTNMALASDKKNNIRISQQDDAVTINIDLGKAITTFDAKITTKKSGYPKDQISIKTDQPQEQNIIITIVGNYLSINQTSEVKQEKKEETCAKCKDKKCDCKQPKINYQTSYASSSFTTGQTFDKKLDIDKTEIEYNEKDGILSMVIPYIKQEETQGKPINVKIKKEK